MSNLHSHYEVSVWRDIWKNGKFQEQRVCVIGSDQMLSQNKLIEPSLVRNVNGQKSFSFKMYKQYIDSITGKKIDNPFSQYLKNETKIKLYYEDKWYDFYIKNIVEASSNYLYTYQLEEQLVQELSKNGYNVVFDEGENNNLGSVRTLAEKTLKDTDWQVESEIFVEMVEEDLVYVRLPAGTQVTKIGKRNSLQEGIIEENPIVLQQPQIVLAFYSSCVNKPHRFQFIYLPENQKYENIPTNEDRIIDSEDNQYYCEIFSPIDTYQPIDHTSYFLPTGWGITTTSNGDLSLSYLYRGKRYGFSQVSEFLPTLERYCNHYLINGKKHYGYLQSDYVSPVLSINVITGADFKSTDGWSGFYKGPTSNKKNSYAPTLEAVYGRFVEGKFVSVVTELKNGTYDNNNVGYKPFLKVSFPKGEGGNAGYLVNSGFYDNRNLLSGLEPNEKWTINLTILDEEGKTVSLNNFDIGIYAIKYNPQTDQNNLELKGVFDQNTNELVFDHLSNSISQKELKDTNYRLVIQPKNAEEKSYYIAAAEMYKNYYTEDGKKIALDDLNTEGVVTNKYVFFDEVALQKASSLEELEFFSVPESEMTYDVYQPIYTAGAEKIRTISEKESNYYNILQSIAETFECWLEVYVKDRGADGAILPTSTKIVSFKNYTGDINYASIRYGINLKDISRTFESKQIVTKLIVKENSNEFAPNGFCTISRAKDNPTGENVIYDFQYFAKQGMLDYNQYNADLFYEVNPLDPSIVASGPDLGNSKDYNLQNYYNRIKSLNLQLEPINEDISSYTMELTKLQAEEIVEEGLVEAASQELEKLYDEIYSLTGTSPEKVSISKWDEIECDVSEAGINDFNTSWEFEEGSYPKVTQKATGFNSWEFGVAIPFQLEESEESSVVTKAYGEGAAWKEPELTKSEQGDGILIKPPKTALLFGGNYKNGHYYKLIFDIVRTGGANFLDLTIHSQSFLSCRMSATQKGYTKEGVNGENGFTVDLRDFPNPNGEIISVEIEGIYFTDTEDNTPYFIIQPMYGASVEMKLKITNLKMIASSSPIVTFNKTLYITPQFTCRSDGDEIVSKPKVACEIKAGTFDAIVNYTFFIMDENDSNITSALNKYATYMSQLKQSQDKLSTLLPIIDSKTEKIKQLQEKQLELVTHKNKLDQLFYSTYSRFIQEGTWMSEDYMDDNKYYADSLSVLYKSCYPQVAYTINVIAIDSLPGYEMYKFNLGDRTFVQDEEFFGTEEAVQVVISEITNNLDDFSKDSIKVQNYKNDLQSLFQKITATVQQTQYNTGSYEKAVELAEASNAVKSKFFTDGLSEMADSLSFAGQTTVTQGRDGITLTDEGTKNQMRLIGGAILMGVEDKNTGERIWKTGLTPKGISASLITTGVLQAGEVKIMSGNDPAFRWDQFGLSAFDADWRGENLSTPNPYQFVRFDKYGIYGITSEKNKNGTSWKPEKLKDITDNATFALTWSGLKVTGENGVEANIGKLDGRIISITKGAEDIFAVTNKGDLNIAGIITAKAGGSIGGWTIGENSLTTTYSSLGEDGSFHLYTADQENATKVAGTTLNNWRLGIGANFGVNSEGRLFATGAKISGVITVSEGGTIGGWTVGKDSLITTNISLGKNGSFHLYTTDQKKETTIAGISLNNWRLGIGTSFGVTSDGSLYGNKVHLKGGEIGGWEIGEYSLITAGYSLGSTNAFHMYSQGDTEPATFGASPEKTDWRLGIGTNLGIDKDGNLYATNVNLSGTITATGGSIDGILRIGENGGIGLQGSDCWWRPSGLKVGAGDIGCWSILYKGTVPLDRPLKSLGVSQLTGAQSGDFKGRVVLERNFLRYELYDYTGNEKLASYRIHWGDAIVYLALNAYQASNNISVQEETEFKKYNINTMYND